VARLLEKVLCESILNSWLHNLPFMFLSCFIKGFSIRFEIKSDIYENRILGSYLTVDEGQGEETPWWVD
jgi:hypothetical protein